MINDLGQTSSAGTQNSVVNVRYWEKKTRSKLKHYCCYVTYVLGQQRNIRQYGV